jgi:tripartite ATP-independent transporter DctP family solute receptor
MVTMNSGILASQVKDFAVFDFPFMFANTREADAILDGAFGKKMHAKLDEKGLVGLTYWELGFRNITNSKRPLNKVEDIAGLKLRVIPNPINVDWVKALDANPTPLPFPEVYAALEQKAIDGQENPVTVINANKFFEVQKFAAITNHQYNPQSVMISKKFWDTLSAAEKAIVQDAAVEAGKYQREQARGQVAAALDNMKKNGMQVTEFPAAEVIKFAQKMQPVISKHAATVGEATVNELLAELARVRR